MGQVTGMSAAMVESLVSEHAVSVTVDETLYPLDAIYGAAFTFIDRCYVLLDRPGAAQVRITLTPKSLDTGESALRDVAGELENELLSCAWRAQIVRENRAVIEAVTLKAISGAMGPPTLDELEDFDFTEEAFEDPLGIGLSWEEKYKKKGPEAGVAPAAGVVPAAAVAPADVDATGRAGDGQD
jgi:His-Xaa-Ser system protein HxsD